jgi:hypothetical protein
MATDFLARSDAIEECYEFMLAYAGKGLAEEGAEIRRFLERAVAALTGLSGSAAKGLEQAGVELPDSYRKFLTVLERDAQDSLAAFEVVLAQPVISSQLIDNLNASMHVRALLTDLFLIGSILSTSGKHIGSTAS